MNEIQLQGSSNEALAFRERKNICCSALVREQVERRRNKICTLPRTSKVNFGPMFCSSETILMTLLWQFFDLVLFTQYVVPTFEPVNNILWRDHSNETYNLFSSTFTWYYLFRRKSYCLTIQMTSLEHYSLMVLFISCSILTFESVGEILQSCHSNEISSAPLLFVY